MSDTGLTPAQRAYLRWLAAMSAGRPAATGKVPTRPPVRGQTWRVGPQPSLRGKSLGVGG